MVLQSHIQLHLAGENDFMNNNCKTDFDLQIFFINYFLNFICIFIINYVC